MNKRMEITTRSPDGDECLLIVPHLSEMIVDDLYFAISNDRMIEFYNQANDVPHSVLMKPWLDSLSDAEFSKVKDMCLGSAYFSPSGSPASFELKEDEKKIISAVIFRNLAPLCEYMNSNFKGDK